MTEENSLPVKQDVCSIRIAFPVISDEQAIEYKKKIAEILRPVADAQIQFSILTTPLR